MTKEEYIDRYLDKYEQDHPNERIDYEALREKADCEWYDLEVSRDNATEYDLTEDQQKIARGMIQAHAVDAYGKTRKRERKANPDKQEIIQTLDEALTDLVDDVTVANPERMINFTWKGIDYSIMLTAHRKPKTK